MKLGVQVSLTPGYNVLHGDPAPPPPKGHNPNFLVSDTTAFVLKRDVKLQPTNQQRPNFRPVSVVAIWLDGSRCHLVGGRLRPKRHRVRWGLSSPPPKRGQSPPTIFGPCLLSSNGWMDQDGTWRVGRPRPRPDGDPALPPQKGGRAPPQFSAHVYLPKRLDATRCHLVRR